MEEFEPWLRGPMEGVPPFVMPVFFSFQQTREDLARFTAGLSDEQLWQPVDGASLGFHLKHIAGSSDRLTTYLAGEQLTPAQLRALAEEHHPDCSMQVLLDNVQQAFAQAELRLRALVPEQMFDPRWIGRKKLPTTVLGLLVHVAEHTQRHLGQAITITKAVRRSP